MKWVALLYVFRENVLNDTNSHIIRVIYDYSYETIEITGPQMVLTMKLTTFAWNVYDGRRPVEVGFLVLF